MASARLKTITRHFADIEDASVGNCSGKEGCDSCDNSQSAVLPSKKPALLKHNRLSSSITLSKPSDVRNALIRTGVQYVESLRNRNLRVFYLGQLVTEPTDHPAIWPSINAVAETYELGVREPDLAMAVSSISGYRVSRFLHITSTVEDVVQQSKMQRKLGQLTGTCFQRCVGMDALNALYSVTFEVDKKYNTPFHQNLIRFLKQAHEMNGVVGGAMTDAKGDRSKRPSEQNDLDVHLRIVERRVDGVIVRGAKTHQTGCVNSHFLVVMPGGALNANEKDFAISFAVPVGAEGITYVIGRQSCDLRALEPGADIDLGNAKYGGQEAVVIFENVFVPYTNIFLDGQTEFCGTLVERFTAYHRRSYICKAGLGDVLVGASALAADFNGVSRVAHIKDKLVEMVHLNETIASCALASSLSSSQTLAGNWLPDVLMANVCKHNVTRHVYEIARLAQDIAGGLLVTLPSYRDFDNPEIGPSLRKYLVGVEAGDKKVDQRRRILRLIENMVLGRNSVGYLTESMHGAGSPQAQRIVIARLHDIEKKKGFAKHLAGIQE